MFIFNIKRFRFGYVAKMSEITRKREPANIFTIYVDV